MKRYGQLSDSMDVLQGTRQGGLSSPFLFNCFYEEMVRQIDAMECGIRIGDSSYSIFCYADDILLASLTVPGLQSMVDLANRYITTNGLQFNPSKSICAAFGPNKFPDPPIITLNEEDLR